MGWLQTATTRQTNLFSPASSRSPAGPCTGSGSDPFAGAASCVKASRNLPVSLPGRRFASFLPPEVVRALWSSWREKAGGRFLSRECPRKNPLPPLEIDIRPARAQDVGAAARKKRNKWNRQLGVVHPPPPSPGRFQGDTGERTDQARPWQREGRRQRPAAWRDSRELASAGGRIEIRLIWRLLRDRCNRELCSSGRWPASSARVSFAEGCLDGMVNGSKPAGHKAVKLQKSTLRCVLGPGATLGSFR
ncbi:uncharacterized protein [Macaca fascicularis]|uniref:uncharacterized protein n=1 Tax=Macaca fascicularis TaxID=9541 RepID=UPI0032B07F81